VFVSDFPDRQIAVLRAKANPDARFIVRNADVAIEIRHAEGTQRSHLVQNAACERIGAQ
jgi:hypothetical protein